MEWETQIWEVDVSGAVVLLNTLAENNMDSAVQTLHNLENIIKQQDIMVEETIRLFRLMVRQSRICSCSMTNSAH